MPSYSDVPISVLIPPEPTNYMGSKTTSASYCKFRKGELPGKLTTTLMNIDSISNTVNIAIIKDFY